MLSPAGVKLSFSAYFPGNPTAAFVAMSVYDDSGVSPVIVQGPTLMTPLAGYVYKGNFTALSGKNYIAVMAVYTDGTFVTIDETFPQVLENFYAEYISLPCPSLVGVIGGNCPADPVPTFPIALGDSKTLFLSLLNCQGQPQDLTSCTEIVVNLPKQDGTTEILKLSLSQVSITVPAVLGLSQVPISSGVSALLNVGQYQDFDVTYTISGVVTTVRYFKGLSVFQVA